MSFLTEYLMDDKGRKSSMRLMSMWSLLAAFAFGGLCFAYPESKLIELPLFFLIGAYAPKSFQKVVESKYK